MTSPANPAPSSAPPKRPGTRLRLLEAAGEEFAAQGFEKATVRSICARADANLAAVNYHFGDKETLYREVFKHAFTKLHERAPLSRLPDDASWRERIEDVVGGLLERLLSAGESWHGRLMTHELAEPGPALRDVVGAFMRPMLSRIEDLIAEVRPDLEPAARELHALSLIGHCVFFRHARPILDILYGPQRYAREDLPRLQSHVVTLFMRGLELPTASEDSL